MNKKNLILGLSSLTLLIGGLSPLIAKEIKREYVGEDNIEYSAPLVVDYKNPLFANDDDELISATSISIHYHNEDGLNRNRAYWIWCNAKSGSQFLPNTISSDGKDMEVHFDFTGEYSAFANQESIFFIIKNIENWDGQSENIEIKYSEFPPNDNGLVEVWTVPGVGNAIDVFKTEAETKMDNFQYATFTDFKTIEVVATAVPKTYKLYALTASYFRIEEPTPATLEKYLILEGSYPSSTPITYNSMDCQKFSIKLNYTMKMNVQYYLTAIFPEYQDYLKARNVSTENLYETARFRQYYNYNGDDLGATWSTTETTFKVWAPTACLMRLFLYDTGSPRSYRDEVDGSSNAHRTYEMVYQPGGIYQVTITGANLHGRYYTYEVTNSLGTNEVADPYGKGCGIDGIRSMVVNFKATNPSNWSDVPTKWDGDATYDIDSPNELSIYEAHIRDLTMDETWNGTSDRGTYSAFIEDGTTYTKGDYTVTTGYDHLVEMGMTAIQLQPVFDNDNKESPATRAYNWGYNPLNYNCVDGGYATNPYYGAMRIVEFKNLIYKFATNENHTRIIMDVVYNHVSNAPTSCFNRLVPKYYFRYTAEGAYYNGSGCGNDVKTEAPMMSKYIVDSLVFWATEYKIKGFRFDLMGLIDWQTMQKAAKALYEVDPDIYLYGEGWTGDGSDAHIDNENANSPYYGNWGANTWTVYNKLYKSGRMCFIGAFNDAGRNALKGGNDLSSGECWGFIDQDSTYVGDNTTKVADMLVGYHSGVGGNPNQCVNYASCHDNYTLFDQLSYTLGNNGTNTYYPGITCAGSIACECAILFSNGVAFIQGGEELFRSKVVSDEDYQQYGETDTFTINGKLISHNSYRLSDATNAYKWDRKIYVGSTYVLDYVQELEKAIELRKSLKKYSYEDYQYANPYSSSSDLNVWGYEAGSTCIGMKNNDHFFFLAGCNDNPISFGAYDSSPAYNKQVFCSNPKSGGFSHPSTGYIQLGWATCVCLTKED